MSPTPRLVAALLSLALSLELAGGAPAATPNTDCAPCADSARSIVRYPVVIDEAGLELLSRAVGGADLVARREFHAECEPTRSGPPRRVCTALSPETIRSWRAAVAALGHEESAKGAAAGATGIATLAALDRALVNFEQVTSVARGRLVRSASGVRLEGCDSATVVTGAGADSLASAKGTDVWLRGYCRGRGRIEWLGGHPTGGPRLDLFVMSHCPFSKRLEASIAADLERLGGKAPVIAVHYVLHWVADGAGKRVGSTHGESERREDAVQILIRDLHPSRYWRYLSLRSGSDATWETLARQAGLTWEEVGGVERRLSEATEELLRAELAFNAANFPFVPESPTVYWQGFAVDGIGKVPGFTVPPASDEKCPAGEESTGQ